MNRQGRPIGVQQPPQQRTILTGSSRLPNGKQIFNGQPHQSQTGGPPPLAPLPQQQQQQQLWGPTGVTGANSPNRSGIFLQNSGPSPFPTAASVAASGGVQQQPSASVTSSLTGASLDLSDFPALGSAVGSQISHPTSSQAPQQPQGFAQVARNGTHSPAPPGLQGRPLPVQQPLSSEPQEDFPALPGMAPKQQSQGSDQPPSTEKQTDMDKYGMNGLLGVIRMENNDQTTVAIGNDLRNLGLNFNPTDEPLSKNFSSPWIETSKHKTIPEFRLPQCYEVSSAVPQQQKIQNLTEETLFYMFYTMPRDSMQEAAAVELTNRNWRYHKELKLWLTKDPLSEPVQQTAQAESGIYVFFDPSTWEKIKKEYVLYYPDIA